MILALILIFTGLFTGLIDSVVGGGGLISLPVLTLIVGAGAESIGTNKIVGSVGALMALYVYWKKGYLLIKEGLYFALYCALGSFLGSSLAPLISKSFFQYFILAMCPLLLYLIFNPDKFFNNNNRIRRSPIFLFVTGILSGFYDGLFGPGGGTFMFLSLYFGTGLPLLNAIAISKLANVVSASTALVNYAFHGFVHWKEGSLMALGMSIGAYLGAHQGAKRATKIVRPMLFIIVVLLMMKLLF